MDKWLDAYAKWPPMNQLVFSCVGIIAALVILFLFGLWLVQMVRYIAVACRGWPKEEEERPHVQLSVSAEDMAAIRALLEEVRRHPTSVGPTGQTEWAGKERQANQPCPPAA